MWLAALLAETPIGLIDEVDQARDWIDYLTVVATVFAALGTVGAVVVALFGPTWQARRGRPEIFVESRPSSVGQSGPLAAPGTQQSPVAEFAFELGNRAGRETARDVELFLSHATEVTEIPP